MTSLLPLLVLFLIMYMLILRPQQQKAKKQRLAQSQIGDGDHVMSAGGIYGRVTQVVADKVWVEIAPDIEVIFARTSLNRLSTDPLSGGFADSDDDSADQDDYNSGSSVPDDLSSLDLDEKQIDPKDGDEDQPGDGKRNS
ncbi:MAG: preprotein translocase subunit YajC [Acidimicrobiaceae bacterium]|nr:preprotein translocase subunit YajC [Acidimicrobiaceae bacterium]